MSTNDRKIIRTQHVPTGEMIDFYLSNEISPSVQAKIQEWEKLQAKIADLKGDKDKEQLTDGELKELAPMYADVNSLGLQIFASILDPVDGIPAHLKEQFGYRNKFEFIKDCAKSNYVIAKTINFFYSFLPSSTESLEARDYLKQQEELVQVVEPSTNSNPSS